MQDIYEDRWADGDRVGVTHPITNTSTSQLSTFLFFDFQQG